MTRLFAAILASLAAAPAFAQAVPGAENAFAAGFVHPLLGWDHVLAMVAVGLWAASSGGRALWALPTAFVSAMVVGFLAAAWGVGLILVEPMILVSVIALGLAVALAVRMALAPSVALVALFALFHGHAHGTEIGASAMLGFGAGLAVATALLHAIGVIVAVGFLRGGARPRIADRALRGLGVLTAGIGVYLAAF